MQRFRSARWRHEHRQLIRRLAAGAAAVAIVGTGSAVATAAATGGFGDAQVGPLASPSYLLPDNAKVDPAGTRAVLLDGTTQAALPSGTTCNTAGDTSSTSPTPCPTTVENGKIISSSISPDGKYMAALTWNDFTGFLTIIDLQTNQVIQQVGTDRPGDQHLGDYNVSTDGPFYSNGGKSLWFGQGADLIRFTVDPTTGMVDANPTVNTSDQAKDPNGYVTIPLVEATANLNSGTSTTDGLPAGMAFSADGSTAYVALNGSNQVAAIDTGTNKVTHIWDVGNAPRGVVLAGGDLWVANEGGAPAKTGQYTNNSDGTPIVANPTTGAATTGTVSVIDLATGARHQIPVGLQPTEETYADGVLFVADSNSSSVSVIDPRTMKVATTINIDPVPGAAGKVGSNPDGLLVAGHTLYVAVGRDDAVAEYQWNGVRSAATYMGLIPTDWYPVRVAMDPALGGKLVITNAEGVGSRGPLRTITKGQGTTPATGFNTYGNTASITEVATPSTAALASYTQSVYADNDWAHLLGRQPHARPGARPVAIPTAIGSPSLIKHVFLIIRENRTYDQVFGDLGPAKGGDPANVQFGSTVTPNAHALSNDFVTFDNYYDPSTLSADGHNWLVQANPNDYNMTEFGAFYRSYPAQGGDSLAYQRDGFIWNAAERAGRTVQAFGEYNNFIRFTGSSVPTWSDWYRDSQVMEGKAAGPMPVPESAQNTYSDIPSLNTIDVHAYPAFDLDIPDQYRADVWLQHFRQSEQSGKLADLTLIWLPDDHTSGNTGADPTPRAEVADNDLALGRIISAISKSQFWKSSAVFVTEDDAQNGVDHVDGHRAPLLVASPYAKRGTTDPTYYNQVDVVRTIEQILGIQPMNQEDSAAQPMYNDFTNTPNFAPFMVQPNNIPLTEGVTTTTTNGARAAAYQPTGKATTATVPSPAASPASLGIPAAAAGVYQQWHAWAQFQHFGGAAPRVDFANPALLNRYDWYMGHDWSTPYPGDPTILAPDQVPGRTAPTGYGYEY